VLVSDTSNSPNDDAAVGADAIGSPIVQIVHAERVDDELVEAFQRLIPQLSSSSPPPGPEHLAAIVDSPDTVLFVARVDGRILGCLTLAFYRIPTGLKAWIEDVVVDEAARGRGVGAELNLAALAEARARGAKDVNLTSRPAREPAHRLYQRVGFHVRDTSVYRYTL
jgi:ribosomal protein S18 acetylase RimI-like enzyme